MTDLPSRFLIRQQFTSSEHLVSAAEYTVSLHPPGAVEEGKLWPAVIIPT